MTNELIEELEKIAENLTWLASQFNIYYDWDLLTIFKRESEKLNDLVKKINAELE